MNKQARHLARVSKFSFWFTWLIASIASAPIVHGQRDSYAGDIPTVFSLVDVANGFGQLLPHRVSVPDEDGLPTGEIRDIRTFDDLGLLRPSNPVLPSSEWPEAVVLPGGAAGNHFVYARFDQDLAIDSVLDGSVAADGRSNLTGRIRVVRVDPLTRVRRTIRGRAFIGGRTYGSLDPANPGERLLERWVAAGVGGSLVVLDPRGLGFPGTESALPGLAALLVEESTFVFLPDLDDDLASHEAFPSGVHVQVEIRRGVRSRSGAGLEFGGRASSTVGPDVFPPEVRPGTAGPAIDPPDGALDVDPRTDIKIAFTEPIQLLTVGPLAGFQAPALSPAVSISFGPPFGGTQVPFALRPVSPFDFSRLVLDPALDFPGSGSGDGLECGGFGTVSVDVFPGALEDLVQNASTLLRQSSFTTAPGVGLVNAPVTPDAIYVARERADGGGLSVLDLNGFGQGTGNPTFDPVQPILEGNSNFPNNPNVALQGTLLCPPLSPGNCTFNGGSAGVFSLTRDTSLDDVLLTAPHVDSVGDMALGQALDLTFNNGAPFGCQAGGGNLCAATGLKQTGLAFGGPNTVVPDTIAGTRPFELLIGHGNLASWAPHPNPPPLLFPPLCAVPHIGGQEPSAVDNAIPVLLGGKGLTNLLVPGPFPLGDPDVNLPPQSILSLEQNGFFSGPSLPQPSLQECFPYSVRQQIGQFLYLIDRTAGEVTVVNSNRMSVLERIRVPDPTALAMSPELDFLAVTSEETGQVFFIDVDPMSSSFHQIAQVTQVGTGPRGVAWDSLNEDILVCNTGSGTMSILSSFNLEVRKTVADFLTQPIDVVITPRQAGFGLNRNVYYAYVLNADGTVAVFESGPAGVNGWGFDDMVAVLPFPLASPKAIQVAPDRVDSAFWVLHEGSLDMDGNPVGNGGAATLIGIVGGPQGTIPLIPGEPPSLRGVEFGVLHSIGEGPAGLTGIPVDLAFDNQRNLSATTNFVTSFSPGTPLEFNGKSLVKLLPDGIRAVSAPQFLFLAVPSSSEGGGVVDVIELVSGTPERVDTNVFEPGVQSIRAPGVRGLMDYFRQ